MNWRESMTPEVIATLIASFGAIMAALFGIWRASGGGKVRETSSSAGVKSDKTPVDLPSMVHQYLERMDSIERGLQEACDFLREIRRSLEETGRRQDRMGEELHGTGRRQGKMVDALEEMSRTIGRIEAVQGSSNSRSGSMQHHHELMVQILAQIREEIKMLRQVYEMPPVARN